MTGEALNALKANYSTTLLKPLEATHGPRRGFFGWFNRTFDRTNANYVRGVHGLIGRRCAPW
jgi:hypothetical protein